MSSSRNRTTRGDRSCLCEAWSTPARLSSPCSVLYRTSVTTGCLADDLPDGLNRLLKLHHKHNNTELTTSITTTTIYYNHFTALCPGLPGWAGTRSNTHPPAILIIIQSLSASFIYHDPQHPPYYNYVLGNLFAQHLSMSSLVYLLVWSPPPHIPYISSPNQCLLFAAHAHTTATCFAVVSVLYHLFLVFLLTPYLELCLLPILIIIQPLWASSIYYDP